MATSVSGNSCRPCTNTSNIQGCPLRLPWECTYYTGSRININNFALNTGDTLNTFATNLLTYGLYQDSGTIDFTTAPLSATIKVSSAPGNALSALPDGIFAEGLSLTAANNGVSMSVGDVVQLGNDVGVGSAVLLNNREIPLSTFGVNFLGNSTESSTIVSGTGVTFGIVGSAPTVRIHSTSAGNLLFHNGTKDVVQFQTTGDILTTGASIFLNSDSIANPDVFVYYRGSITNTLNRIILVSSNRFSVYFGAGAGGLNGHLSQSNVAVGHGALPVVSAGGAVNNTAIGAFALQQNTSGTANTAIGQGAMFRNITGSSNVCVGSQAAGITAQSNNTIVGFKSTVSLTNANGIIVSEVTSLGFNAGSGGQTFTSNTSATITSSIFIGVRSGIGANTGTFTNITVLANDTTTTLNNVCIIGNSTQNILIGQTIVDNGNKVQIAGNQTVSGSIGIGVSSINGAAILQADSTTKGFLPPRMTTIERDAISSPVAGLMVYNLTTTKLNVYTTVWEEITSL